MGHKKMRDIIERTCCWTEKGVPRHKHCYDREMVLCIHYANAPYYFHVNKCRFCRSFRCIPQERNITGFLSSLEGYGHLEMFHMKTRHNLRIGFQSLGLEPFEEESAPCKD